MSFHLMHLELFLSLPYHHDRITWSRLAHWICANTVLQYAPHIVVKERLRSCRVLVLLCQKRQMSSLCRGHVIIKYLNVTWQAHQCQKTSEVLYRPREYILLPWLDNKKINKCCCLMLSFASKYKFWQKIIGHTRMTFLFTQPSADSWIFRFSHYSMNNF